MGAIGLVKCKPVASENCCTRSHTLCRRHFSFFATINAAAIHFKWFVLIKLITVVNKKYKTNLCRNINSHLNQYNDALKHMQTSCNVASVPPEPISWTSQILTTIDTFFQWVRDTTKQLNTFNIIPWAAATTGMGRAVEKMKERPLDWIHCFHFRLHHHTGHHRNAIIRYHRGHMGWPAHVFDDFIPISSAEQASDTSPICVFLATTGN